MGFLFVFLWPEGLIGQRPEPMSAGVCIRITYQMLWSGVGEYSFHVLTENGNARAEVLSFNVVLA